MDFLKQLNPEQKEAVTHEKGPLLIVAGAGTGKTTVITQKIAWLILKEKAKPEEILAVTFTDKAANEMEERVDQLLPYGYVDLWVSTFHSFAQRVLEADGLEIGLPNDFKLLNTTQAWMLVRQNLDKFNLDYYRPLGNPTKFIHALIKHFSRCKDELVTPKNYLQYAEELKLNSDATELGMLSKNPKSPPAKVQDFVRRAGKAQNSNQVQNPKLQISKKELAEIKAQEIKRLNEVAEAYHVYQKLLLDNNALDFGDLINYCLKLFQERLKVLQQYRDKFKYILVDEFQDTNYAQYQLIRLLAAPKNNLTVVADDDQSIYKFRGASVSNILEFKKGYPKSTDVFLTTNYRSKQNILDLSYDFIQLNNPDRLEYQLKIDKRTQKKLQSLKPEIGKLSKKLKSSTAGKAEIKHLASKTLDDEVDLVIKKILELKDKAKDFSWNDNAILVRANDYAKPFLQALERAGIPTQFLASTGLYSKPVIMDIIAYLKLLDNYHESPALFRILNLPIFKFKHHDLVNLNYWAQRKSWSLFETLKQAPTIKSFKSATLNEVNKVLALIEDHTQLVREKNVGLVILAFLEDTGYLKYLTSSKTDEAKAKQNLSYLNQFYKKVKDFEQTNTDSSVKAFLEGLEYELESGEEGSLVQDIEEGPEAVKILTVHSAKGLEFKYVFIVNLVDRRFPSTERQEAIELPDALVKEILPTGDIHLQEERRLFYVAMTRAKQGLYLTAAENYGGVQKKKPSRFLVELNLVAPAQSPARESVISYSTFKADSAWAHLDYQKLLPKEFSFTQLKAFTTCPYQYRFAHILKVPIRGKGVFSYGKTIHLTLQRFFQVYLQQQEKKQTNLFNQAQSSKLKAQKINPNLDQLLQFYNEVWIDDWYENKQQKEKYYQQGKEVLKKFYQSLGDQWPEVMHLERTFHLKLIDPETKDSINFKGVIDRQDKVSQDEYELIDYKTGEGKADKKLRPDDKQQLLIYQIAAQEVFQEKIKHLTYYYVDNNSRISFLGTDKELAKQKERMIKTAKEIKKGKFPPTPGQQCKFCDFHGICEYRKL